MQCYGVFCYLMYVVLCSVMWGCGVLTYVLAVVECWYICMLFVLCFVVLISRLFCIFCNICFDRYCFGIMLWVVLLQYSILSYHDVFVVCLILWHVTRLCCVCLCLTREFFTRLGTHGNWAVRVVCHTYYDTGHPFIMVISEDPWHSYLLPSV